MNVTKLTKALASTATFLSLSIAHAGDMGSKPAPVSMPYIGGEASYSWIQRNDPLVDGFSDNTPSKQHWGGRLSAGILRFHTDKLGFTGEIGGGYYGSETVTIDQLSVAGKTALSGYDVLVGALYKLEHFDVFGQVGFMIENNHLSLDEQSLAQVYRGGFISGSRSVRANRTEALPEIRVGGIYNFRDDLGMTLTYMHAFGATPSFSGSASATRESGINLVSVVNVRNPTLNSVLLGLRYYIV